MSKLTLNELKLVTKSRVIKDYEIEILSDLIKILSEPKTKTIFSKWKIRDIRRDFIKSRHKFSKSKIRDQKKSLQHKKIKKSFWIINSKKRET